ncbi:MAG: DUF4139 domain-containing protein, partial [Candidatus Eisenbacteria bacterium]|nr:DUF4139 domain-containing protein [Candidatus Latescibacterota bacterium]MBD3302522.1 DUF4139 domain-containing protein [Candidatus Eisenbacteria bacterium]
GTVSVADVASRIDPTSVHLRAGDGRGGLDVLEQNYRYDLAGPERILERYLDTTIDALLENGDLRSGKLQSFGQGQIVLLSDRGLSMLQREKIVDLRFPSLPEGLITRPTLVWDVQSERPGAREVELSYLTNGISWHAEYVAVTNKDDTAADLSGWVSVDNRSGAAYPDARLQLIAGDVHRVQPERPTPRGVMDMRMAGAEAKVGFEEESFFEYHLYTLPRPTTVRDRETKQISLFPPARTGVEKVYEYQPHRDQKKIRVVLQFENSEENGLGMPLPKGKVRTYKRDSRGGQQFVGEDRIDHTPKDEEVRLGLGNAFDIVPERTVKNQTRVSDRVHEMTVETKIRNHKQEKVTVVVQERFWGDWEVIRSTHPTNKRDAYTAEWSVEVGPDVEEILEFTVRMRR